MSLPKNNFSKPMLKAPKMPKRPGEKYFEVSRKWQGMPTAEITGSRIWAGFMSGGNMYPDEYNYSLLIYSDDGGMSWSRPTFVLESDKRLFMRVCNVLLWCEPSGRLRVFWTETRISDQFGTDGRRTAYSDTYYGVWTAVCDDPSGDAPVFSEPQRLSDGIVRNKPTVLPDGSWLLPICDRGRLKFRYLVSADGGKTFTAVSGALKTEFKCDDDQAAVLRSDGVLWALARTGKGRLSQTFSADGGVNWTPVGFSLLDNPSSRFFLGKMPSGRILLINHYDYFDNSGVSKGKINLTAMLSDDDGQTWRYRFRIDSRQCANPDAAVLQDGRVLIIYEREHKAITAAFLSEADIMHGKICTHGSFLCRDISVAGK